MSNIINLEWSQINIFSEMIILETTKNGQPHSVPMTENVHNILKALFMDKENGYVFGFGKDGKPFNRSWVGKSFRDACKDAGIKNFKFHDLRHSFCTKLAQRGVDIYKIAKLAGHEDIRMTQRYSHHCPESLRDGVEALEVDRIEGKRTVLNVTKTVLTLLLVMVGATGFEPATS